MLRIDNFAFDSNLGSPFKKYFAVWVQGCNRNCPGCIAHKRNSSEPYFTFSPEFFARMILSDKVNEIDGIVISGGEPFLQASELVIFIDELKRIAGHNLDIICYTGYTYEEFDRPDTPEKKLLERIDVLIDGEYRQELNSGNRYKGSDNQRMIFLSEKYSAEDFPDNVPRRITISSYDNTVEMKGIPSRHGEKLWKAIKEVL